MNDRTNAVMQLDVDVVNEASQWAGAFLAGFKSDQTRRAYRRDLHCWFTICAAHQLHPSRVNRRVLADSRQRQAVVREGQQGTRLASA